MVVTSLTLGPLAASLAAVHHAAGAIDPSTVGQYGALGVLNAALLAFARVAYNREKDRADAERANVEKLQELYRKDSADTREALRESLRTLADLAARNHT